METITESEYLLMGASAASQGVNAASEISDKNTPTTTEENPQTVDEQTETELPEAPEDGSTVAAGEQGQNTGSDETGASHPPGGSTIVLRNKKRSGTGASGDSPFQGR